MFPSSVTGNYPGFRRPTPARVDCHGPCTGNGNSVLDEPTTYLDIRYQIEILELVRKLNREFGMTIVMVLHDINQSIYFSDKIIGLAGGKVIVEGEPEEVITEESIHELYGIDLKVARVDGRKFVLTV